MKPLSILAPIIVACIVFALIVAVLNHAPTVEAAQGEFAVPLSGAAAPGLVTSGTELIQSASVAAAGAAAGAASGAAAADMTAYPGLDQFSAGLYNGSAEDVVGVYVRDIMALPVLQQPDGLPDFVASEHNQLTEFQMPKLFGSVGLLAHNYLSGSRFTQLPEGTEIVLVFGDGRIARYQVTGIDLYQALEPNSPVSDFVHPDDPTRQVMSSAELFQRIYTSPNRLVLQTCVEAYGDPSWGRMFVIAEPVGEINLTVPQLSVPGLN